MGDRDMSGFSSLSLSDSQPIMKNVSHARSFISKNFIIVVEPIIIKSRVHHTHLSKPRKQEANPSQAPSLLPRGASCDAIRQTDPIIRVSWNITSVPMQQSTKPDMRTDQRKMKAAARVDGDARRPERKGAREKGRRPSWGKSGGCGHAKLEGGPSYGSKLCCCKASGRRC